VTVATSPALSTQAYRERLPAPGLADLASCVWRQQISPDGPAYEHRTVPNGCIEVACVRGGNVVSVIGPRREPVVECLPPGTTVVGVRFRPGVPAAVLGATAQELMGIRVELDQLWGRSAVAVAERIALAATPGDAARVLEREIMARCVAGPEPDALVAETVDRLQPWRRGGLGEITSDLFISSRQLRRRCTEAFGFGPKTLHRILRFQGFLALTQAFQRHEVGLGWLAAAAGYFDQAHLTRECLALTGLTPVAFLEEMRTSCGANHDHDASFAGPRRALVMTRVASLQELREMSASYKRRPQVGT
jgi:AraC-like DNA-binding protein